MFGDISSTIRRHSYADQEARFNSACLWLAQLGVKIQGARVARYARDLRQISHFHEAGRIDELVTQHGFPRLINSLVEATELIDLHEGLKYLGGAELVSRLQKFIRGSIMASDESPPGNLARNIGFELSIAATAASAGLPVQLEYSTDILVSPNGHDVAIECKRPFSYGKVDTRIHEGLKQLTKRCGNHSCASTYGILALSVSKIENDGTRALKAQDAAELEIHINDIFNTFMSKYEHSWIGRVSRRTLAILLHLRTPCFVEHPSLLTVASHFVWVSFHQRGSIEREIFDEVSVPIAKLVKQRRGELS